MPSSSSSDPSGTRRRPRDARPRRPPRRDWSELPLDAISYILGKLGVPELLAGGAAGVCRSWRRAAREDPSLWRHVNMRDFYRRAYRKNAWPGAVARAAVKFSAGQCEAFWGMYDVNDDLLLFLSEQAPLLKSLRLSQCNISNEGFKKAIEKFPLLEELELELCESVGGSSVYEFISEACPQLKHYGHTKERYWRAWIRDGSTDCGEAMAIARMHELRSLQLFRINLSNEGLAAILDGYPHLEYLDIRNCCNIIMDDTFRAKCARIKKKKLLIYRSNDECKDFEPGSPISYCSTCCGLGDESDTDNDALDIADLEDFSDSSYDLSGVDEIDIDEHDRITEKNVRRYL